MHNRYARILVTYASKAGSTGEVADFIGQTLCANETTVDVLPISDGVELSRYDAVIVGSAIRMGRWLGEAVKFVETNQAALSQVPTAYFTVCLTMKDDTEENRREVATYLEPVDIGMFAGKVDYSKLSFLERLLAKAMKVQEADRRDWDAIRGWTEGVCPMLLSG